MRRIGRAMVALTAAASGLGCNGTGPFGPIDPAEVHITLSVTGGFAFRSYEFVVDGAALEVIGTRCEAFCDFEAGERLLPVSHAQVADLARRLDQADVFGRAGDYGGQCCDGVGYQLTYRRGARTARVTGDDFTLPPDLATALRHIATLGQRRLPMLVAPDTDASDWPRSAYTLGEVEEAGLNLTATVTYGGGCALHRMDLVAYGHWLESDPVQVNALVTHDDGGDPCDGLVTEERVFDLSPLARAYIDAYGPPQGPIRITLRLWDPLSGSPLGRVIQLEL